MGRCVRVLGLSRARLLGTEKNSVGLVLEHVWRERRMKTITTHGVFSHAEAFELNTERALGSY